MTILSPLKRLLKPSQENSVSIKNVSFCYDKIPSLERVSLSLSKGDFAVFFGPNGGGKTTLFKLLLGFLQPTSGSITLFGQPPDRVRHRVGYVPQKAPFDPLFPLTTLEVILQGALSKTTWWGHLPKLWKEKGRDLLNQLGLATYENKRFGELSGGLAQRTLIARALLAEPSLLLLDEPTTNVDPQAEEEILKLLLKLKGKTTLLLITHNLETVTLHADHLFCIHRKATPYLPHEVCNHLSLGLYSKRETNKESTHVY